MIRNHEPHEPRGTVRVEFTAHQAAALLALLETFYEASGFDDNDYDRTMSRVMARLKRAMPFKEPSQ